MIHHLWPEVDLELWAFDEHRLGLKPVKRRMWAPLGSRVTAGVHPRYTWLYVYSFIRPQTGESVFWLLPWVNAALLSAVLADFAKERRLGQKHWGIVVLDQAGWHTASELMLPEGVLLCFLPSLSPELQPAERLWPLVDAGIANGRPHDEQHLWQRLERHCAYLRTRPKLLQAHTRFHWWPATLPAEAQ